MKTGARRRCAVAAVFVSLLVVAAAPAWGDLLTVASTDVAFGDVTLNGSNQTTVSAAVGVWTITDVRLTGAPWTVSISATTPTSAAGTVETTPRTVAVSNLSVTAGTITAQAGSDPVTNITGVTSLVLSNTPQTLVSSTGTSNGVYLFTPTFSFTMPANAYRSNYSGAVNSSSLNPYTSTLTVTIA